MNSTRHPLSSKSDSVFCLFRSVTTKSNSGLENYAFGTSISKIVRPLAL